jgi:hypothetical protein
VITLEEGKAEVDRRLSALGDDYKLPEVKSLREWKCLLHVAETILQKIEAAEPPA